MNNRILNPVLLFLFVAGQGLIFIAGLPVWGGALSLGAAAVYLLRLLPANSDWLPLPLGVLGLAAAVYAQATVRLTPSAGLLAFALAGLLLFLSKPKNQSLLDLGRVPREVHPLRRWEIWFFIGLCLFAVATRFYLIGDIPAGATGQEGELAGYYIANMEHRPYMPYTLDYGNLPWPTMTVYQGAFFANWLGWTAGHIRYASAIWSVISILVFYFVARRITSPGVSAIVTLLFSVSILHLVDARRYFPYAILFVPVVLGFGLILAGIRKPDWKTFALAGLAGGLSLHGYDPGKGVFLIFLFWLIGMWMFHRRDTPGWRLQLWFWGCFILMGSSTLIHMFLNWDNVWYYHTYHANANRGKGLLAYYHQIMGAVPTYAKMFHVQSDPEYAMHPGLDPILDPVSGLLFGAGFFLCLAMFWEPVPMFLIMFLVAGIMPAMIGTNYAHPTTRRVILALPAVYLIAGMALERLRRVFFVPARTWLKAVMALAAVAVTGWTVYYGLHYYYVTFAQGPGTKAAFNYRGYLAAREIRRHPAARITVMQRIPGIHDPMMMPRVIGNGEGWRIPRTLEDILVLDPSRENLLLLEGIMEPALEILQAAFPHAQTEIYREKQKDDPACSTYFYHKLGTDSENQTTYLIRMLVPAEDVRSFQTLLDVTDPKKPERTASFQPGFASAHAGRALTLTGTLLLGEGGACRFRLDWPGWRLRVDGRPAAWNQDMALDGGAHDLELSGTVPQSGTGALPLRVFKDNADLAARGRVVALPERNGLRLSCWKGVRRWDGAPDLTRREYFPMKRFYDNTDLPVPFSARFEGRLCAPQDGEYEFRLTDLDDGRLKIDGQEIFNNFDRRNAPRRQAVRLAAGRPVVLQGDFVVGGESMDRTFMVHYRVSGQKDWHWVPFNWFTEQP